MEYQTDTATTLADGQMAEPYKPTRNGHIADGRQDTHLPPELAAIEARYHELSIKLAYGEHQPGDIEERQELGCRIDAFYKPIQDAFLNSLVYENGVPLITNYPNAPKVTSADIARMMNDTDTEDF